MDMTNFAEEQIERIVEVFLRKNKKKSAIKELKQLPAEDQGLYSLETSDNEKYVICIYDIDLKTQKAVYWMDRYTYYGNIEEVFNDQYITLVIYSRGEKYQNEYLVKHYNRTAGYPMTELIPEQEYPERLATIRQVFSKNIF
jgi:hypothetical protein